MSSSIQRPEPELLDHLRLEFGDNGRRAAEFISTAYGLIGSPTRAAPQTDSLIAYCLREAMVSVLESAGISPSSTWEQVSREVVSARKRYATAISLPGQNVESALDDILSRISELGEFHDRDRLHERRLIALMISRTGAEPLTSGTKPVRHYQELLHRLNASLHGSHPTVDAEQLWLECIAIFRQLFLPPEIRHAELDNLAQCESPTTDDRDEVIGLLASPTHLLHFLSRVASPSWLEILEPSGILDPPNTETAWPAFASIARLAKDHRDEITAWLEDMYEKHATKPRSCFDIARVALEVGEPALALVLRALRDRQQDSGIIMLGRMAVKQLEASDELLISFADILLNEQSWSRMRDADPLMEQIASGVTATNAVERIGLLCQKVRSVSSDSHGLRNLEWQYSGTVTDQEQFLSEDRFTSLVSCLIDAIERAWEWTPTEVLLEWLENLPTPLLSRLRAWILASAPRVESELLIKEIEQAISSRGATGDDLGLIDRATNECEPSTYAGRWRDSLGPPPTVEQAGQASGSESIPPEWRRAIWWITLLPPDVAGPWTTPYDVLTAQYGPPNREDLEHRARAEAGVVQSPFSAEHLGSMDPEDAARVVAEWKPDPGDWLVGPRELARTLESAVRGDPEGWTATPIRMATRLHHPLYICHYLKGLAAAAADHQLPVEDLIDLIKLVRTHPWHAGPIGDDRTDQPTDWEESERAAVDLIKALAESGCTFDHRADEVWQILVSEVTSCSPATDSTVVMQRDPYHSAINRPSTRALEAVFTLIDREFCTFGLVRSEATDLLQRSLCLTGRDGAEHRSVIAPRIGFLRYVLPDWTEDNRDLLFGKDAPEELAQATIDQAIRRGPTNAWLLQNFRDGVRSAVKREVDQALSHLLVAMLWECAGYSVQENVGFLLITPELASRSGEVLGSLLRNDEIDPRILEIATEYWGAMLQQASGDALLGFGCLSMAAAMDSDEWAALTLQTLQATSGRIDMRDSVADRASELPHSRTSLAIMDLLVRAPQNAWGDLWIAEKAVDLLDRAHALSETDDYRRLLAVLLERGTTAS